MAKVGLTEKQKRFVDFYIETGNATESAKRAGYKEKAAYATGAENLKKPQIKAAISARIKELDDARTASAKEVLHFLSSSMRGEVQEDVVVVEGEGDGYSGARVLQKQISASDRIKAAALLAKRYGLDKPEDADGEAHITFKFERGGSDGN